MLKQAYQMKQNKMEFFSFDVSAENQRMRMNSLFMHQLAVSRQRGGMVLENVFRPFLQDYVNPFKAGSAQFDIFNQSINNLISTIKRPPDLELTFTKGDFAFQHFKVSDTYLYHQELTSDVRKNTSRLVDYSEAQYKLGTQGDSPYNILKDSKRTADVGGSVKSMDDLVSKTLKEQAEIDSTLRKINDEIASLSGKTDVANQKYLEGLKIKKASYQSLRARYDIQLADAASEMTVNLRHMGTSYKTSIAKKVQVLLNQIPLNPFKWGMFGRALNSTDDAQMIGQLFSFHRSAQMIEDAITGENTLKRILKSGADIVYNDKSLLKETERQVDELNSTALKRPLTDAEQAKLDNLESTKDRIYGQNAIADNIMSRVKTFDDTVDSLFDFMFNTSGDPTRKAQREFNRDMRRVSKEFARVERNIVEGGKRNLKERVLGKVKNEGAGSIEFRALSAIDANGMPSSTVLDVAGTVTDDYGDRLILNLGNNDTASIMDDLIDATADYQQSMSRVTNAGGDYLTKAVKQSGEANISNTISDLNKGLGRNILAENGILSKQWAFTAIVFSAIALDSFMQSTSSGASMFTQMGFLIGGADYQQSVEAKGTRFLPVGELAHQAFGFDPVTANVAASLGTIGLSLYFGRKVALSQANTGFMEYTLDSANVTRLLEEDTASIFVKKSSKNGKAVFERVRIDKVDEGSSIMGQFAEMMKGKGQSKIYIAKAGTETVDDTTKFMIGTLMQDHSVKLDSVLRVIPTNVGVKTMAFATVGLLALGAARDQLANVLNSMTDTPGALDGLALTGGLAATGFVAGVTLQYVGGKVAQRAAMETAKLGTSISGQAAKLAMKGNPLILGAIGLTIGTVAGFARLSGKIDPDKLEGGSLDPLVGGILGGAVAGILTGSPAAAVVAGTALALGAATLNWAGIKFFRTASRSNALDYDAAQKTSTLGRFTSATLDMEGRASTFALSVAAFAAQSGAGISLNTELGERGEDVRVVARQSPLPFLQFFVAERVKGRKFGKELGESTALQGSETTYSVGVQTGPLFGTSLSLELPVIYTPKKGFYGLSYNPDSNFEDLITFTGKVGAYSALYLGGAEYVSRNLARVYKGVPFFGEDVSKSMFMLADGLGHSNRTITSAAARINDITLTTTARTLTGLYGVDAILAFNRIMQQADYSEEVIRVAMQTSFDDIDALATTPNSATKMFSSSEHYKESLRQAKKKFAHKFGEIRTVPKVGVGARQFLGAGRNFVIGAAVGAAVIWAGANALHQFRLRSSQSVDDASREMDRFDNADTNRLMATMVVGGFTAGAVNAARKSFGIVNLEDGKRVATYSLGYFGSGHVEMRPGHVLDKMYNLGMSVSKGTKTASKFMLTGKVGKATKITAVFAFLSLMNYIKADSSFGISKFMDRHLVYSDDGSLVEQGGRSIYQVNRSHQMKVAGTVGAIYTGGIVFAMRPAQSRQESMLKFAIDESAKLKARHAKGLIYKVDKYIPGFVKDFRRLGRDADVVTMMEQLQIQKSNLYAVDEMGNRAFIEASQMDSNQTLIKKLVDELGEDDIDNFVKLHRGKKIGALSDAEIIKHDELMQKMFKLASTTDDDLLKGMKILTKNTKLSSFGKRAMGAAAVVFLMQQAARFIGGLGGEPGKDTLLDRLYQSASKKGMSGSLAIDGKKTGFVDGMQMVLADAARLFIGRDRVDLRLVQEMNRHKNMTGEKLTTAPLMGNYRQYREHLAGLSQLRQIAVVDKSNPYLAMMDFGGKTLRQGDKGGYTTTYFQLQGPGHDVSTAAYSMSAKYMFSQYAAGRGEAARIMTGAMARFNRGEAGVEEGALMLRNVSSMTQALKTNRQIKRIGADTEGLVYGDPLTSQIIAARNAAVEHMSWQPIESLFTNMFFETMDKARQNLGRDAERYLMSQVATSTSKNQYAMEYFMSLHTEGAFGNVLLNSTIKNMVFFTGGGSSKNKARKQIQTYSNIWLQEHSLEAEAEKFKQAQSQIISGIKESVIVPLSSTGIMTFTPPVIKYAVAMALVIPAGAYTMITVARFANQRDINEAAEETMKFFDSTPTYKSNMYVQGNTTADVKASMAKDLEDLRNSDVTYKTLRRARGDAEGLVSAVEHSMPINSSKKLGKAYTVTVTQNNKSYRFSLPDAINDLKGTNAAETATGAINRFADVVERFGNSFNQMNRFVRNGEVTTIKAQVLNRDNSRNIAKRALEEFNGSKGKNYDSIYDVLRNADDAGDMLVVYKGMVANEAKEVMGQFVKNVLGTDDLSKSLLATVHTVGENEFFLFEILQGRADTDGLKEFGNPQGRIELEYSISEAAKEAAGPDGVKTKSQLAWEAKERRLEVLRQMERNEMAWIQETIEEVIDEEIATAGKKSLLQRSRRGVAALEEGAIETQHLMIKIAERIQNHPRMERYLKTFGGTMTPESLNRQKEVNGIVKNLLRKGSVDGGTEVMEALEDVLQYAGQTSKIGPGAFLKHSAGAVMNGVGAVFDIALGLDAYGAYARVGEALNSPYATNVDVELAKQELGKSLIGAGLGIGIGLAMFKGAPLIGAALMGIGPVGWGIAAVGTVVIGGAMALGGYKNVVKPLMHRAGVMMEESRMMKKLKEKSEDFGPKLERFVGNVGAFPVIMAGRAGEAIGGARGKEMATNATAQGLGGLVFGAAAAAFLVTAGVGLATAGIVLATGAIAGIALGAIFGDSSTKLSTKIIRDIEKLPILGQFLGPQMTKPYTAVRDSYARKFRQSMQDSPFSIGYIGDIVNENWMSVVKASGDYSGADMVRELFGNVLDNSAPGISPAWRANAADSIIGSPRSITDGIIQRELRLRAQAYGENVIGDYQWNEMVKIADNGNAIKAADDRTRAYKLRQLQIRKAQLAKEILRGANNVEAPSQQMVNAQEANKNLDLAIKRVSQLENNEGTRISQVNIDTSISQVRDPHGDYIEESYLLAIGPNTLPPRQSSKYTVEGHKDENNNLVIEFNKEVREDNDIALAIGHSVTNGAKDSMEHRSQEVVQNLVAHETLMTV